MTTNEATWSGTVIRKRRALLDGSNLYRRVEVRLDDGTHLDVKVERDLWKKIEVGDRLEKSRGEIPRRCQDPPFGSD